MREAIAGVYMDKLPPTQYLICEVLAARFRTGEKEWSFPKRLRAALNRLTAIGLISYRSAPVPDTLIAWLTEEGREAALSPTYVSPNELRLDVMAGHRRELSSHAPYPTRGRG